MTERGVIRNRGHAMQIRDFGGLRWGTITPTDIDGVVDFQDKAYVLFELKFGNTDVPFGQRLAIERMCQDWHKVGKKVLGLIARHNTPYPGDIDVSLAQVVEVLRLPKNGSPYWGAPQMPLTVKEATDLFLHYHKIVTT